MGDSTLVLREDAEGVASHLSSLGLDWSDLEHAALETIGWNRELSGVRTTGDTPIRVN